MNGWYATTFETETGEVFEGHILEIMEGAKVLLLDAEWAERFAPFRVVEVVRRTDSGELIIRPLNGAKTLTMLKSLGLDEIA